MNRFGLIPIAIGIFYLMYSILFRSRVTIYFSELTIVKDKEDDYLSLQLYFSVFNAFILIAIGSIAFIYNLDNIYVIASSLVFQLVNSIMKKISKSKGYVES